MTRHRAEVFLLPRCHVMPTAVYLFLPGLDSSCPQLVLTRTDWSRGHRKRVHRTPIGAAEGNITVVTLSGNCLVRWCYLGLSHRLQHFATSTGPSSTRSLSHGVTRWMGVPSHWSIWGFVTALSTKLQLRDNVASCQRDNALHRGSAFLSQRSQEDEDWSSISHFSTPY